MKIAVYFFLSVTFFTCHKNRDVLTVPYSEASYKIIISMNWASPAFGVPAGAHFTSFTGMVHNKDTFLWKPGAYATKGLEDVAEVGSNINMNIEIDAILFKNKGLSKFTIPPPNVTGTIDTNLTLNTFNPYISFASMIAPSPDWFIGLHDFSLLDNNNAWINDITVNLLVYDAGTEDGDVFGYNNPETTPKQSIALLTPANGSVLANGNTSIAAIGTVRFIKN